MPFAIQSASCVGDTRCAHKHLKSTNMLERLNEEIRRRTHVVRIFPNGESCLRLVRALAVETHENWLEQQLRAELSKSQIAGEATGAGVSGLLTSAAWFAEHGRGGMDPDPRHAVRRMARICSLAT